MKINICDVCYREKKILVKCVYKLSYKNCRGARLSIDSCEKHKDFFEVCKSYEQADKKVNKLYGW